jgi:hypothetical protein
MNTVLRCGVMLVLAVSIYAAQKFDVRIVKRQDSGTRYSYTVPASSRTSADANVNCVGTALGTVNSVNCSGSSKSTTSSTPSQDVSYDVTGATLSLLLPDGRLAVVNCDSKLNWTDFSKMNQVRRSCKIPLVNNIQAEFDGDKAKLKWSVSIDGKKLASETYKILAVIDKP